MQRRQRAKVILEPPPLTSTDGGGTTPPVAMENWYARRIKSAEAGWRATGDPWFFAEVVALMSFRDPVAVPAWVSEAAWIVACESRTDRQVQRARERDIRSTRYCAVRDIHAKGGRTWDETYAAASEALAGTRFAGEEDAMAKAYKTVRAHYRGGGGGLYNNPQYQRRKPIA